MSKKKDREAGRKRSRTRKKKRRLGLSSIALSLVLGTAAPALSQDAGAGAGGADGGGGAAAAGADGGGEGINATGLSADDIGANTKISRIRGLQTNVPDVYRVKRGDTLWDITNLFFKNPYLWPAVWSYNPHITNPHWIYPDDLVFLTPGGAGSTSDDGTIKTGGASDASIKDLFAYNRQVGVMVIPVGYYTDEELADGNPGRLVFSPEAKRMLTLTDEVYLDWEDEEVRKSATPGQRFGLYRESPPVVNVDEDEEIARKLEFIGVAEIVYNDGQKLPTAIITEAMEEIERGDLALPLDDMLFRLTERTNGTDTEGKIIDSFDIVTQFGQQQYVLINRGAVDGVAVGNRFVVFEQREGLVELPRGEETRTAWAARNKQKRKEEREGKDLRNGKLESPYQRSWPLDEEPQAPVYPDPEEDEGWYAEREYERSDLPLRKIGEIIVVKTSGKFSTALITQSTREFNLGTRVTLINNY